MSEVKGGVGTPNQNSTAAANTPPAKPIVKPVIPTSNPAPNSQNSPAPQATPAQQNIQFHSNNITTVQSARRQDPFAEQNAKAAEKKKQNSKIRKRIFIIVGIVLALVLAGLIGWMVYRFMNPVEEETTAPEINFTEETIVEDLDELTNAITNIFNPTSNISENGTITVSGNLSAVEQVFNEIANNPKNEAFKDQINLEKLTFYIDYGFNQEIIDSKDQINPDNLDTMERVSYYTTIAMAYYYLGDTESSNTYEQHAKDILSSLNPTTGVGSADDEE